jgi:hypothetical protein
MSQLLDFIITSKHQISRLAKRKMAKAQTELQNIRGDL